MSLDAALAAAQRGWAVFPVDHPDLQQCAGVGVGHDQATCIERGKHPAVAWSTWATVDAGTIVAEWSGRTRNVGIACGPSGLVVIDEDKPGEFQRWVTGDGHTIPATFTVATAHGRHWYFKSAAGVPIGNRDDMFSGFAINVRGGPTRTSKFGGYVVGAGSKHRTGATYTADNDHDPAAMPLWLVDALTGHGEKFTTPSGPYELPEVITSSAIHGPPTRDDVLYRYACSLQGRGVPKVEALASMQYVAFPRVEQPDAHPYPLAKALSKVENVYGQFGDDHTPPGAPRHDRGGWRPVDLSACLDGTAEPERPTLMPRADGVCLLYPGKTHSLHGEPESGKSFIAQAEAARVLEVGGRVVYLDYESDEMAVVGRLLALGATPGAIRARLDYLRPDTDPSGPGWLELIGKPAALVVIDGVTEAFSVSGVTSKDNDEVAGWLRRVTKQTAERTGAAVAMVDHVVKDGDARGRYAIGAQAKLSALTGAAYTVEVDKPMGRGLTGVLHLRIAKDRPGAVRPHAGPFRKVDRTQLAAVITFDSTSKQITVVVDPPTADAGATMAAAPFRPTTLMERASRVLENLSEAFSFNQVAERTEGKRTAVRAAVDTLVAEGYVGTEAGSRNAVLHRSVRPYRGADDPLADTYLAREPVAGETERNRPVTGSGSLHRGTGNQSPTGSGNQSGISRPRSSHRPEGRAPGPSCAACGERIDPAAGRVHPSCEPGWDQLDEIEIPALPDDLDRERS